MKGKGIMRNIVWVKRGTIDDSALKRAGVVVKDLMFYINLGCNLRCKTCYIGNEWLNSNEKFSFDEAKIILKYFGSAGLDRLTFLGGEPVLHPNITDLIIYTQKYPIKERRMTTNAVSLGFLDLEKLQGDELSHISVSFDGITPEIHEKIRGKGTFKKTVENVKKLINHGFKVNANFTVTGVNKYQVVDSLKFFKKLGIGEVNFHLVSMIGNASNYPELYVEPLEWVAIRKQLLSTKERIGIRARIPLMFVTPKEYKELLDKKEYYPFQIKSYHSDKGQRIVLYPNGKVYMSCDLTGTDYNFASFKDGVFSLNKGINELSVIKNDSVNPDPSTTLLSLDTQGFIRLSISFKKTVIL